MLSATTHERSDSIAVRMAMVMPLAKLIAEQIHAQMRKFEPGHAAIDGI